MAGGPPVFPRFGDRTLIDKSPSMWHQKNPRSKIYFGFGHPDPILNFRVFVPKVGRVRHRDIGSIPFSQKDLGKRRTARRCARWMQNFEWKKSMTKETVKWFNAARGYGFIAPEDGAKDDFVHILAVEHAGLSSLREGQKLSYDVQSGQNGKSSAENLSIID